MSQHWKLPLGTPPKPLGYKGKRTFDLLLALGLILIMSPAMASVSLLLFLRQRKWPLKTERVKGCDGAFRMLSVSADSFARKRMLRKLCCGSKPVTDAVQGVPKLWNVLIGGVAKRNPFQFAGQQFDADIGQYYLRNRYYDPALGRFLVRDPIRYQGGMNLYVYASNNPVNAVDPLGLDDFLLGNRAGRISDGSLHPNIRPATREESQKLAKGFAVAGVLIMAGPGARVLLGRLGSTLYTVSSRNPEATAVVLETAGYVLSGADGPSNVPATAMGGAKMTVQAANKYVNKHGALSTAKYTIDKVGMGRHTSGMAGKSQFFNRVNADELVLDAAHYADEHGLWDSGGKAKLIFTQAIGVHGRTGQTTNVLNLYRRNKGQVHGAPGTPKY